MSVFWSSALAALMGALVGGAFTAFGAAIQARASLRAVEVQLRQTFAHERRQREELFIRDGIAQRMHCLSECANALSDIADAHLLCDASETECDRSSLPVAELRRLLNNLYTGDDIYNYEAFSPVKGIGTSPCTDILSEFIRAETASMLDNSVVEPALKSFGELAGKHCNYYIVASYASDEVTEKTIKAYRTARDSI
jgi:hypothetical protein